MSLFFFFQAEDGIRDIGVTGVQTCALPISHVYLMPQVLPAPGETRSMPWLLRALAERLGLDDFFPWRDRSEERRVGKECRSRWWPYDLKKKAYESEVI